MASPRVLAAGRMRIVILGAVLTMSLLTIGADSARAAVCTETWAGPSGTTSAPTSGEWSVAGNWSPATVPSDNDSVCITGSGSYTVTLAPYSAKTGDNVTSLTLGASAGNGTQTLDVSGQAGVSNSNETTNIVEMSMSAAATITPSGKLVLDATSQGTGNNGPDGGAAGLSTGAGSVNEGQIVSQVEDAHWQNNITGTLTNAASATVAIDSGTTVMNPFTTVNDGSWTVASGATLAMEGGGTFTNDGSYANAGTTTASPTGNHGITWNQTGGSERGNPIQFHSGVDLSDSAGAGSFVFTVGGGSVIGTIPAGQTVEAQGFTYNCSGNQCNNTVLGIGPGSSSAPVINRGTIVLDAPGSGTTSGGSAALVNSAPLENFGTLVSTVEDTNYTNSIQSPVTNEPGGTIAVSSGKLVQTNGASVTNQGTLAVGPGARYVLASGALTNASSGAIAPQLASASNYGTIDLTGGTFTAGGALSPTLEGGFAPSRGEEFQVVPLDGGTFSGTFATTGAGFTADYSHENSSPAFVGVISGHAAAAPANPVVRKLAGGAGKATVTLSCPAAASSCRAYTVKVSVTEHIQHHKAIAVTAHARQTTTKQVTIAHAGGTVSPGRSRTVSLKLNAAGTSLLTRFGKLHALAVVTAGGKRVAGHRMTITRAKTKRRHKH